MFTIGDNGYIHMSQQTMDMICTIYNEIDKMSIVPFEINVLELALDAIIDNAIVDD